MANAHKNQRDGQQQTYTESPCRTEAEIERELRDTRKRSKVSERRRKSEVLLELDILETVSLSVGGKICVAFIHPTMEAKKQQQIKERTKRVQYENRKSTLLKGGKELSILCNINVCIVILSPDGKLETWPENLDDVMASFRDAAESNKRPRSNNSRKGVCHNPSQVKIGDDNDDKRANKKMKTISDDSHVIRNNLQGEEEGDKAGVPEMGNKTEDQPFLYNCCGNYYPRFPTFGEWNNNFAQGIVNYENQSRCPPPPPPHHHHQGCSCSCVAWYGSRNDAFLVSDPSCSNINYGGGGYSSPSPSPSGYEFLNLHKWNNDYHASGAARMFHPLLYQQPLQIIGNPKKLGRDFQFGSHSSSAGVSLRREEKGEAGRTAGVMFNGWIDINQLKRE